MASEIVQRPKDKGGLGVINLRLQNDALLLKHLHRFYKKLEIPWIQLIWHKYYQIRLPMCQEKLDPSGGRTSCASTISIEELQNV